MTRIGVLALQGDFREHMEVLDRIRVETRAVRLPKDLAGLDGLIIPGGESTTIVRLMATYGLRDPVKALAQAGKAVWGSCAGMIVVATEATDLPSAPLGLIDVGVRRNAFGRQVDSFEANLEVPTLGDAPFHAIFIRAPVISRTGAGVETLACLKEGAPVAARQDNVLVTAFHPELTSDARFHQLLLQMAQTKREAPSEEASDKET